VPEGELCCNCDLHAIVVYQTHAARRNLSLKLLNAALKASEPTPGADSSLETPSHPVVVCFNGVAGIVHRTLHWYLYGCKFVLLRV
jgi:hypothetical protein